MKRNWIVQLLVGLHITRLEHLGPMSVPPDAGCGHRDGTHERARQRDNTDALADLGSIDPGQEGNGTAAGTVVPLGARDDGN